MTRKMFASGAVVIVLAALLTGCGQRNQAEQSPSTSSATPTSSVPSSSVTPSVPTSQPVPSAQPEPAEPAPPVLADGRYAAYLTAIDTRARTVTFDVVQYLTGAEAAKAFHRDHPEITEDPPNGYYIVNQNPRLRTLPVHKNVVVQVCWLDEGLAVQTIPFDRLPGYFAKDPEKDKYIWYDPFWLTVRADRIEVLFEQYIP